MRHQIHLTDSPTLEAEWEAASVGARQLAADTGEGVDIVVDGWIEESFEAPEQEEDDAPCPWMRPMPYWVPLGE